MEAPCEAHATFQVAPHAHIRQFLRVMEVADLEWFVRLHYAELLPSIHLGGCSEQIADSLLCRLPQVYGADYAVELLDRLFMVLPHRSDDLRALAEKCLTPGDSRSFCERAAKLARAATTTFDGQVLAARRGKRRTAWVSGTLVGSMITTLAIVLNFTGDVFGRSIDALERARQDAEQRSAAAADRLRECEQRFAESNKGSLADVCAEAIQEHAAAVAAEEHIHRGIAALTRPSQGVTRDAQPGEQDPVRRDMMPESARPAESERPVHLAGKQAEVETHAPSALAAHGATSPPTHEPERPRPNLPLSQGVGKPVMPAVSAEVTLPDEKPGPGAPGRPAHSSQIKDVDRPAPTDRQLSPRS